MNPATSKQTDFSIPDDSSSTSPPASTPARGAREEDPPTSQSGWRSAWEWVRGLCGGKSSVSLKEAIETLIRQHEGSGEKPLSLEEKHILRNVLSLGDIQVSDIMTPRSDITAVPYDITLPQLKSHVLRHRHTRIPVYRDTFDQMLGFIHVKDLLPMLSGDMGFELKALMRDLLLVSPSMRVVDLLVKMRKSGTHMAFIVDEYGGTDGLVTLEDLFEEIVGDIQDEHDGKDEDNSITRLSDKMFEVSARIRIETLQQQLGLTLATGEQAEEFDTLGGLIFFQLGRVPAKGEVIPHGSRIKFEIIAADPRRIHKVKIIVS